MTKVEIDLNVRTGLSTTYAGFENVDGNITLGPCIVYESESGLSGKGSIIAIDRSKELVYLVVDWKGLDYGKEI